MKGEMSNSFSILVKDDSELLEVPRDLDHGSRSELVDDTHDLSREVFFVVFVL